MNDILFGDCRELIKAIPDESIDMVFTDPPYDKANVHLYAWLAEAAARVLKPGGFCFAYCGSLWLPEIYAMMSQHLTYYWQFINLQPGSSGLVHWKKVQQQYKVIVGYSKGLGLPNVYVNDIYTNNAADKRYHKWGQTTGTAGYFISRFSQPGETILEPFAGGGTTCIAAKQEGRNFIAFEQDTLAWERANKRLQTFQPKLLAGFEQQLELLKNT